MNWHPNDSDVRPRPIVAGGAVVLGVVTPGADDISAFYVLEDGALWRRRVPDGDWRRVHRKGLRCPQTVGTPTSTPG